MNRPLMILTLFYCCWMPAISVAENKSNEFSAAVAEMLSRHRGVVAVATKHLETGVSYQLNADRPMPTASLIKFPIMAAAYQAAEAGELDLDKTLTLTEEDKVPGSGILTPHLSAGAKLPLKDAIRLMICYSDNTATNLVIDQIGLPATTEFMNQLGCPNTRLHAKVYRRDTSIDVERSKQFGLGSTTATEMISLLEALHQRKLVSPAASQEMKEHLLTCESRSKVPRYLPPEVPIAHKTGSVSASRCDAGIIESPAGPIAYCILTTDNADRSWGEDNEAELLAAEFGRALYAYFNDGVEIPPPTVARVLKVGADGPLVEALQRTLNARVTPSPDIGVDGDFGPNTKAAVVKFQKQAGVEVTGEVGPATWRMLGPLLTEDAPAPNPQEVNNAPLVKQPADRLDGPPMVSCKAYAIADRATGELLWGYNDSEIRDPASVTKIMTAYLVTSLAEQDPSILENQLTFSKTADDTSGSTSGVRVGERLTVLDALYGLMLPSGNDMSVALAEHFGDRLSDGQATEESSYQQFIAAMNTKAAELGMKATGYRNPHGLTAEGHVTSAGDLVKLARAALEQPLFCKVVATPRYGCTLESVDGYQRNVVWKNTNRLLRRKGFDGVKTGTTGPAGACLVSSGRRDGRGLIVAVLGSTSSDARYIDSRNLYRWAWRELDAKD